MRNLCNNLNDIKTVTSKKLNLRNLRSKIVIDLIECQYKLKFIFMDDEIIMN